MSSMPLKSFQPSPLGADLLARAASILGAEVARLQPMSSSAPRATGQAMPVLDPTAPIAHASNTKGLESQLLSGFSSQPASQVAAPLSFLSAEPASTPMDLLSRVLAGANADELRRRASDFLETLLASLGPGKAPPGSSHDDQVPLLRSAAPVQAGTSGSVTLRITNEESSVSEVSLYASNFVADSGYDISSLLASFTPRRAVITPGTEVTFEIKLAVPAQAPPGLYSGLVQAVGCKYVKAVIMFEVL